MPAESYTRLPNESPRAWAAFVVYRDLGPNRSIDAAFQSGHQGSTKRAPGRWKSWSVTHDWIDRAAAYDAAMDKQRQADLAELRHKRAAVAFHQLSAMSDDMTAYVREKCLRLSPVTITRNVTDADGNAIPTTIKGLPPSQTAALARAVVEIEGVLVNGHVRLTGKLPEATEAQTSGPFQFVEGIEENA